MSLLSPRLQLRVAQKQILTPGLVQMVTVLQLNRLELKEMINQEMSQNPVLEESAEMGEEMTPEEVQALIERERLGDPADSAILQSMSESTNGVVDGYSENAPEIEPVAVEGADGVASAAEAPEPKADADPFDEIDFGSFFDDYLDPGYKTPSSESVEKPSFETFLSAPVTLAEHLQPQLAMEVLSEEVRDAADVDHRQPG